MNTASFNPKPDAEPVLGYRLLSLLGRGGFGEVWKAEAPGRIEVALKLVRLADGAGDSELRALEVLRSIRHPNLLPSFGVWEKYGFLIIAMELADRTLFDRFHEAVTAGLPGIPREELLDYLRQAASGIDFLNDPTGRPGIQHRDIKPQNILLVGSGVKVADFGLARFIERSASGLTGSLTPAYAAPEFFHGKAAAQSDQYSLAVTYCQLRCGRLPFEGSLAEVMAGHLMQLPDLTLLPQGEQPAVARALAKEPRERWPSCRAFVEALTAAQSAGDPAESLGTLGRLARPPARPAWAASRPRAGRDGRRPGSGAEVSARALGFVLLALLLLAGISFVALWGGGLPDLEKTPAGTHAAPAAEARRAASAVPSPPAVPPLPAPEIAPAADAPPSAVALAGAPEPARSESDQKPPAEDMPASLAPNAPPPSEAAPPLTPPPKVATNAALMPPAPVHEPEDELVATDADQTKEPRPEPAVPFVPPAAAGSVPPLPSPSTPALVVPSRPAVFTLDPLPLFKLQAGARTTALVAITRDGFQGPVALSFHGLPSLVTISPAVITPGASSVLVEVVAERAAPADVVAFTAQADGGDLRREAPGRVIVQPVLGTLHLSHAPELTVEAGGRFSLSLAVRRIDVSGPVEVQFEVARAGVTIDPLTIPTDADRGVAWGQTTSATARLPITLTARCGDVRCTSRLDLTVRPPPSRITMELLPPANAPAPGQFTAAPDETKDRLDPTKVPEPPAAGAQGKSTKEVHGGRALPLQITCFRDTRPGAKGWIAVFSQGLTVGLKNELAHSGWEVRYACGQTPDPGLPLITGEVLSVTSRGFWNPEWVPQVKITVTAPTGAVWSDVFTLQGGVSIHRWVWHPEEATTEFNRNTMPRLVEMLTPHLRQAANAGE